MGETLSIKFVCVECGNTDAFKIDVGNEHRDYHGIKVECVECGVIQGFTD
jgi:hypothetical protein